MSEQYAHGIAADWKQRSAMSSASKVGAAYTGWIPREPSKLSGHLRAVLWALLAAGFLALGEVFW